MKHKLAIGIVIGLLIGGITSANANIFQDIMQTVNQTRTASGYHITAAQFEPYAIAMSGIEDKQKAKQLIKTIDKKIREQYPRVTKSEAQMAATKIIAVCTPQKACGYNECEIEEHADYCVANIDRLIDEYNGVRR